jgi:hypothetical protein
MWLVTYPVAGWVGTHAGFTVAWSILAVLAVAGAGSALMLWPREVAREIREPEFVPAPATPGAVRLRQEAEGAEGTLVACQCTCVHAV